MMAARRSMQVQPEYGFARGVPSGLIDSPRSSMYQEVTRPSYDSGAFYPVTTSSSYSSGAIPTSFSPLPVTSSPGAHTIRSDSIYSNGYNVGSSSAVHGSAGPSYGYNGQSSSWDPQGRISPESYLDDFVASPASADYAFESSGKSSSKPRVEGKSHSQQRRPSNRDEFDGPHRTFNQAPDSFSSDHGSSGSWSEFLQRPPPEYIAQQERDLPHLPTNLVVHEQDSILSRVNDRLSQCAFDFVAKYQFPIPLSNGEMRPVERPQDREWTEWVFLLKRLATKRRIPARVLYQGQIKQFITILENSLEMRHAAKHQSRPLKDDRNILQLISAGIQVAKLLRDADAMSYMDQLYDSTERLIQQRIEKQGPKFGYLAAI